MDTNIRNFFVKIQRNQEILPEFLTNRIFSRKSNKVIKSKNNSLKIRNMTKISDKINLKSELKTENQNEKIPPYCPV